MVLKPASSYLKASFELFESQLQASFEPAFKTLEGQLSKYNSQLQVSFNFIDLASSQL
jgi:hypothetical protein